MNKGEDEKIDISNSSYRYVGLTSDIKRGSSESFSIKTEEGQNIEIAIFNLDGTYYAISNSCIHKGGPPSKGFLEGDIVTCPWHGWKYSFKTGKSLHKGGDSVNSYPVKIIGDKIYVDSVPAIVGKRIFQPHEAYLKLKESVDDYLIHKSDDSVLPVNNKKIRILGISTTNANDKVAPRRSTSEDALGFALEYAKNNLGAEAVMIKLRELEFSHCEDTIQRMHTRVSFRVPFQKGIVRTR